MAQYSHNRGGICKTSLLFLTRFASKAEITPPRLWRRLKNPNSPIPVASSLRSSNVQNSDIHGEVQSPVVLRPFGRTGNPNPGGGTLQIDSSSVGFSDEDDGESISSGDLYSSDEESDSGDEFVSEKHSARSGDEPEGSKSAEESDIYQDEDEGSSGETGEEDGEEAHPAVEESESSEDEVEPRNTIGEVPLEWYKEEEHIGYDISGKKIRKQAKRDKIDSFLAGVDDSKNWRKIYDEYIDEEGNLQRRKLSLFVD